MTEDAAIVRACAKVNLVLRVGPRRADGYHELVTLIARISLADVLLVSDAPAVAVDCPGLPGGDTLVTRALRLLCEASGHDGGFHVHIDKRIPHGAGLAAMIGSDVPALLHDEAVVARGRGDRVEVLGHLPAAHLALAHPGRPLATRDVYQAYVPGDRPLPDAIELPRTLEAMAALVENDLAEPAERLEPGCRGLREQLAAAGAMAACVSGSGSVVFGLFGSEQEAAAAAANLEGAAWTTTAALGTDPAA